ncbi:MAG TPA: penicillin-insensitive murein endopeptidase [Sandaracinaceae bacterium LLY-WYZ-13_1]|nr:penicillin-insensitive murein endopeptidase [Sandaracinaceae bacterium LLY-WYZ-13_1]
MRALAALVSLTVLGAGCAGSGSAPPSNERRAAPRTEATGPETAPTEATETEATEAGAGGPERAEATSGEAGETDAASGAEEDAPAGPDPIAQLMAMDGSESTSIGGPRDGRLEGGVPLPASGPGFLSNPRRPNEEAFYGTVEMVQALVRAAAVVHEEMGGETMINDLGFEEGGPITHHGSHRAGRDVDVLFYLIDRDGEPMRSVGAFLDRRGVGVDFKDLAVRDDDVVVRLDAPRTWRFVQALLEGPHGHLVQRIFVAEHLRTRLMRAAERSRAPEAIVERFGQITCQPGAPHDDHLHIRFYCTLEDLEHGCEDSPPIYGWHRLALREAGRRAVLNRPRPDRPMPPRVSVEEARANAGPMHPRVEHWLEHREAWLERPHPGRPFCR